MFHVFHDIDCILFFLNSSTPSTRKEFRTGKKIEKVTVIPTKNDGKKQKKAATKKPVAKAIPKTNAKPAAKSFVKAKPKPISKPKPQSKPNEEIQAQGKKEEPRRLRERVRKPQVKVPPFNESSINDTSAVANKENQDDNER